MKSAKTKMLLAAAAAATTLGITGTASAQLSVTGTGPYTINFDEVVPGVVNGPWAGTGFQPNPDPGQMDSDAWAVTGWSDGSLSFGGTRTSGDYARGAQSTPQTTGGFYAFSGGSISGVALGIQPGGSDWAPGTLTLRIQNNTSDWLKGLDLGYVVHIRNDQQRANSFNLSSSTNDVNYAAVAGTNTQITSGEAGTTGAPFEANTASATLGGISVAPGDYLYLRWSGADVSGSGSRDEFALDDIVLNNLIFGGAPKNLTWNSFPTGTWDKNAGNTPWLEGGTPSAFADGDNVTFHNPSSNTTVTVGAGGVTPASFTINNSSNSYTFAGGAIAGGTTLVIGGGGTVTFANNNTFNGGTTAQGGTIITQAATALGLGGLVVQGPTTLQTDSNLTIAGGVTGTQPLTKTGAATLSVGGSTSNSTGATLTVNAGKVEMTSVGGLGGIGSAANPAMPITLNSGTELLTNFGSSSFRASGPIVLNSATITRPNGAPDGDSQFDSYIGVADVGGSLTVNGNSIIQSLDVATGTGPGTASVAQNSLGIRMPVHVTSGSTLTIHSANSLGDFGSNAVSFRGVIDNVAHPNDGFYLQAGSNVVMTGPGEKRFGATTTGKPIIGQGTSAAEATLKLDERTFLTDIAASDFRYISRLVVSGEGTGGLRIEAPMNATYAVPVNPAPDHPQPADGTTGLFGLNETSTQEGGSPPPGYFPMGNAYTVMSPKRYNQLSDPFGSPNLPLGGTLTLAATDPAGATGVIDNGPNAPTPIKLALDNASGSGDLVYKILPQANDGKLANFGGLVVQRTHTGVAGTVTAKLDPDAGVLRTPSIAVSGAQLDLTNNKMIVTDPGSLGSWNGSNYTGVTGLIQSGRNEGTWDGNGIVTSLPEAQVDYTTLGVATASDVLGIGPGDTDVWAGQTVTGSDTLVMYTYGGDANLDGVINIDDYGQIDFNVGLSGVVFGYFNGDFNYDGLINIDDYGIIDFNIGIQGPPFPTSGASGLATSVAMSSSGVAAVPEPASVTLLALGAMSLLGRRSRRQK